MQEHNAAPIDGGPRGRRRATAFALRGAWPRTKRTTAIERCPGRLVLAHLLCERDQRHRTSGSIHGGLGDAGARHRREGVDARAHNDMPVICSEHLQGVAFTNHMGFSATPPEIGPDAEVVDTHELDVGAHISGGAFTYDRESDRFLMTANGEPGLQRDSSRSTGTRPSTSASTLSPSPPLTAISGLRALCGSATTGCWCFSVKRCRGSTGWVMAIVLRRRPR